MQKIRLLGVVLLLAGAAHAQKVDLDRYNFSVLYRVLPRVQIDTSYHTYNFTCETGPLMKVVNPNDQPQHMLEIEGWRRLDGLAHISVHLKMEDLIIMKTDVTTREEVKKDKNGNVVSRKNWYAPVLTYTYAAHVMVKDYKGRQMQQYQLVSRSNQHTYRGTEFGSRAAAANIFLNMFTITTQVSRDVLYRTINGLSNTLTEQYGYADRRSNEDVWLLGNRRHPEYDRFRSNWSIIKNALFKLNPNEPLDQVRMEVKPAIAYFEKLKKDYSGSSKGDRKMRYATHYLLAKLYYYLDEPDMAVKEASDLVLTDYDARDGRNLEAGATYLKEQLLLNKRKTRYFPLDVMNFEGPRNESLYSAQ